MLPNATVPACNNEDCKKLRDEWIRLFKTGVAITEEVQREGYSNKIEEIDPKKTPRGPIGESEQTEPKETKVNGECEVCQKERLARSAVAMTREDERFKKEPFSTAPYIHQLNDPKHAANVTRSMRWAKKNKHTVNWLPAHDCPLHHDDQATCLFYHQRNI